MFGNTELVTLVVILFTTLRYPVLVTLPLVILTLVMLGVGHSAKDKHAMKKLWPYITLYVVLVSGANSKL